MDLMRKTPLSRQQLQDAGGIYSEALLGKGVRGVYASTVPSPDVNDVFAQLAVRGMTPRNGNIVLAPSQWERTRMPPGLRVLVAYRQGREQRSAPGIVLPNPAYVGVLIAQGNPTDFGPLTQTLLSNIYETQRPDVVSHDTRTARFVGGHALVAASYVRQDGMAHGEVHRLANGGNFGAQFDNTGARDIAVGHDILRVRSAVLPVGSVVLAISEAYQPQASSDTLLVPGISSAEINIATTIVATMSREPGLNAGALLVANLGGMQGN